MKTKLFYFACPFLIFLISSSLFSQNYDSQNLFTTSMTLPEANTAFYPSVVEKLYADLGLNDTSDILIPTDYLTPHDPDHAAVFARTMLALGAGFGFGDDETLWCLHAAYYMQLALYTNAALYGSLGAAYNGSSTDNFNSSLIDFQFKLLMFNAITRYNQVHLIYGALLAYGLGTDKFDDGFNTDITRLTAGLILGFNIILTTQLALMLQTNIFAYQSQTLKPSSGNEFKSNNTWGLINKNNILALSLVFTLANSR